MAVHKAQSAMTIEPYLIFCGKLGRLSSHEKYHVNIEYVFANEFIYEHLSELNHRLFWAYQPE